jgi:hypothetical protein
VPHGLAAPWSRCYTSAMSGRRRLAAVGVAAVVLMTTAGCPASERGPREPSEATDGQALPGRPTDATTDLPAYEGPPPGGPPSAGPLTSLRAAIDLTAATPGVFARAVSAVATPDGGAVVVLSPRERDLRNQVVTVGPAADGGLGITQSVPMPRMPDVWGTHLLPDGTVAVTGLVRAKQGGGPGIQVVDPATGALRSTVLLPLEEGTVSATGRSAMLAGRSTLFLVVTVDEGDVVRERLLAVDVGTGQMTADRDLIDDVAAASQFPMGRQLSGLVARPGGGVTVVFDASPTEVAEDRIPTLLPFDADLEPDGDPVRATSLAEGAETQAVSASPDGTVFLLVEVDEGAWILAVPDGGGAGPLLAQLDDRIYTYAMVVEPAQVWALLPAAEGVRAIDLVSGDVAGPVRFDCAPRLDVRAIAPGTGGALIIGECDTPREDTQLLWIVGP